MKVLYYLIGLWLFLILFRRCACISYIMGLKLTTGRLELDPQQQVPEYLMSYFAIYEKQITILGFQRVGRILEHKCNVRDHCEWCFLYFHPKYKCYASLKPKLTLDVVSPCLFTFYTTFNDQHTLITANGEDDFIVYECPFSATLQNYYLETVNKQWEIHLARTPELCRLHGDIVELSLQEHINKQQQILDEYIERLQYEGIICNSEVEKEYKFTFFGALKCARKMLSKADRDSALIMRKQKSLTLQQELPYIPVELETKGFLSIYNSQPRKLGGKAKFAILIISLILFIISFQVYFSFSLEWILLIIGILFIHELGHILGMKLFGYKDLQILFLPFLGALAAGKSQNVPVYQRVIVYLLGPVPGIIIGLFCIYYAQHDINSKWLENIGIMALVINYLNLLPIVPLDGGQIVNQVLFLRFPILQAVFIALGAVAFALGGYYVEEPILYIIAFCIGLGVKSRVVKSRIYLQIRQQIREKQADTDEKIITLIYKSLKEPPFAYNTSLQKFGIARYVLTNAYVQLPGTLQTCVLLIMYLIPVIATPIILSLIY